MKKNNKSIAGFTVIELLVVISIIVVLAAIVLVSITSQINKGKDSAIKGNLSTLVSRGAAYLESTGSYNTFCTSASGGATVETAIEAPNVGGALTCYCDNGGNSICSVSSTKWCACSPLKTTANTFCVDSSGYKKETNVACATRCTTNGVCN